MAFIEKLPIDLEGKALNMRDNNVEAPKLCAEKEIQVTTYVDLIVKPIPFVVDPIQPFVESLFNEVKIQQESKNSKGAHDMRAAFDAYATH